MKFSPLHLMRSPPSRSHNEPNDTLLFQSTATAALLVSHWHCWLSTGCCLGSPVKMPNARQALGRFGVLHVPKSPRTSFYSSLN